jgi:hypothetical protein
MQQNIHSTPIPRLPSRIRTRLILPAGIAEVRAALELRVAQSPDDIAARVSLGELNLSACLAAANDGDGRAEASDADLLRARHVVPNLAALPAAQGRS